jgi:hypothetical protein
MNRNFEWFDLFFFSLLSAVSELMGNGLLKMWNSSFFFSFSTAICLIAMIRWGGAGIVCSVVSGFVSLYFSGMPFFRGVLFYPLANMFLMVPALLYGQRNRDRISGSDLKIILYVIVSHLCLSLGKGFAILILAGEAGGSRDYFGSTLFIMLIDIIICVLLKRREGLLCDMRYYFTRKEEA